MASKVVTLKYLLLAEDHASKVMHRVGNETGATGDKIRRMGSLGATALAGLGVAAVAFGKSSVDKFKEVTMESRGVQRALGGTIEDASRFRFAAHESGVNTAVFTKSLTLLDKNLVRAGGSAKTSAAMAKVLGFNYRDSHGRIMPMNKLLPQLSDKFKAMKDGPEKTALALKLFGKAGMGMLPFLGKGAKGIAELQKQSDKFGQTISGKNLNAVLAAKKGQREWNASLDGLKVQVGAALLPVLTMLATLIRQVVIPLVQKITKFVTDHQKGILQLGQTIMAVAKGAYEHLILPIIRALIPVVKSIIGWIKEHKAGLAQLAKVISTVVVFAFKYLMTIVKFVIAYVVGFIRVLAAAATWLWRNVIQPAAHGIAAAWRAIGTGLSWVWAHVIHPIYTGIKAGIHAVASVVGPVARVIGRLWGAIGTGLRWVWSHTIGPILTGISRAIGAVQAALDAVTGRTVSGNLIGTPTYGPGNLIARPKDKLGHRPEGHAQGTGFLTGGWVGENGREWLNLPHGSKVTTNSTAESQARTGRSGGSDVNLTVTVLGGLATQDDVQRAVAAALVHAANNGIVLPIGKAIR